jgi:hypothetical protein
MLRVLIEQWHCFHMFLNEALVRLRYQQVCSDFRPDVFDCAYCVNHFFHNGPLR